ncbi:HupE/UreJ family protein [Spirosoma flavum]|uniref:HupE/UreJ family protein n=1 Tax=Spirosoma flavum TaxID=2048557 RepID=A0ABW6APW3_9BACT
MRFNYLFTDLAHWVMRYVRQGIFLLVLIFLCGKGGPVSAHPMPNSVVVLTIHEKTISGEIQLPLGELQSAIGMKVNDQSNRLIERLGDSLQLYLRQHIHPKTLDNQNWPIDIGAMRLSIVRNKLTGDYKELIIAFTMLPPEHYDLRNFYFDYDVILREVASHKILISVKQDWAQGHLSDSEPMQVGVIELDVPSGKVVPLQISLEQGSLWKGFASMVKLGMQHIREGTDHLLFLLVLLLPAPLLVAGNRWSRFGGVRYSVRRLLLIVTAFTIGHSLTLLLGAFGLLRLPSQPVEVLIAVSILVSALHALRPLFPGREAWVAAGFGLVHGLAFAGTLMNLHLDTGPMALSILGFNLGIELMQVGIITLVIPWLIQLSQTPYYSGLRRTGAVFAGIAATAWVVERLSGEPNAVTVVVGQVARQAWWLLAGLALLALLGWWRLKKAGPHSAKRSPACQSPAKQLPFL